MAALRPTVLVVEDEPEIRRFLRLALAEEGCRVVEAGAGRRAMIDAGTHKADLAIVDLGLPDLDGMEVIRAIRAWSPMPILVLSARAQERSKIEALDAGADDYVTKPFAIGELLASVRVALRRRARPVTGDSVLIFEAARVDLQRREASREGRALHLTPLEFRLLACLAARSGQIATHRQLLVEVWGPAHERDTHYLRIYMKQLRGKLERDPLRPRHLLTEIGVGYRLVLDD